MPGSHLYNSGWLTKPPVVTLSSSRSHYQAMLLANEFVSNHSVCKCLTQLWVEHVTVLSTGAEIKHLSVGFISENSSSFHIFCGWFGNLFPRLLKGVLIGTVLKQLSDENRLDFIFIIYSSFKAAKAAVVNHPSSHYESKPHMLPPTSELISGPFKIWS